MTVEPKIPGAVIPRRVFTQPASLAEVGGHYRHVSFDLKTGLTADIAAVSFVPIGDLSRCSNVADKTSLLDHLVG
jgi:hypothetical protein